MELELQQAIEILERTPSTLNALLRGLSQPWLVQNEGPETWSPYDIVGHLIHGEETDWIPRAKIILEHGEERAFEPFDRFAMVERFKGKTITDLLDTFTRMRGESL
ncbi:MAG TPA: DinB family protein, partial [Pyrinomonadaceae bacterium]|nr:DinB family protein [Pyrinomonadaceae bacterium]